MINKEVSPSPKITLFDAVSLSNNLKTTLNGLHPIVSVSGQIESCQGGFDKKTKRRRIETKCVTATIRAVICNLVGIITTG